MLTSKERAELRSQATTLDTTLMVGKGGITDAVIAEMTCAGSLLIVALGLNLIGVTKLKILNYLPAVFLPILLCPVYDRIASWLAAIL